MVSVLVGVLLGLVYSLIVHRWAFRTSRSPVASSRGFLIFSAFLRLGLIASVFFLILKTEILNISVVLLSFIIVITLFLLNMARKACTPAMKTSGIQSQGRF